MSMEATRVIAASYADLAAAEADWAGLATSEDAVKIADAALTTKDDDGNTSVVDRQEHHGWGKGAVAGAVVALVAPATLAAGLVGGGVTGAVISRMNRGLDRGDLKRIGEMLDDGQSLIVVVTDDESLSAVQGLLGRSVKMEIAEGKVKWTQDDFERDFAEA